MIEAGIIAVAILIVGIGSQVFYSHEKEKDRETEAERDRLLRKEIECAAYNITEDLKALNVNLTKVAAGSLDVANSLAPLCESLAESLTERMSTIDADMADLRTRVETGPGKRTLRV